ncbi:MAG: hypothetical protein ACI30O_04790 [Muribaculaceae bacterium]
MKRIIKSLLLIAVIACCAVSANAQSTKGTAIRKVRTAINPAQRDAIINSYVISFNEYRSAIHNIRQKCIDAAKNYKTIDELIDSLDEVIFK